MLGEEHPDTLTAVSDLAYTYDLHGRYREAQQHRESIVETMKRVLGDEHLATICALDRLALIYSHEQRYEDAVVLRVQVIGATVE